MIIDKTLLDSISLQAKESERLRKNYNLHLSLDSKVQRLFNAMEPGTIVPIQRHPDAAETIILIRGSLKACLLGDNKNIIEETILDVSKGNYGIHIPAGIWHCVEVLEPDTVIFEVKEGPYVPLTTEDIMQ